MVRRLADNRRTTSFTALLTAIAVVIGVFSVAPLGLAQDEPEVVQAELEPGVPYRSPAFDLTIHDTFVAPSPDEIGFSVVEVSVSVRNTGDVPFVYDEFGFIGRSDYPDLRLRDSRGDLWPIDVTRINQGSQATSRVRNVLPGLSGRWTIGFLVPTQSTDEMFVELASGDLVFASFELTGGSGTIADYPEPAFTPVAIGDTINWAPGITATPTGIGSLVCGDPSIEPPMFIFVTTFTVTNTNNDYGEWPGHRAPSVPATAQWGDGSSADFAVETFAEATDRLWRHSQDWGYVPPGETLERAFVFATPRDGRVGSVDSLPQGVVLNPILGSTLWLDLGGETNTVGVNPLFCDLSFLGSPIPHSFAPGPKFNVGGEQKFILTSELDAIAQQRLDQITAALGLYLADSAALESADAATIAAYAPGLKIVDRDAGDPPDDATGTEVFFDVIITEITDDPLTAADETDQIVTAYMLTKSTSGSWLCQTTLGYAVPDKATGFTAEDAARACAPGLFVEAEETGETP